MMAGLFAFYVILFKNLLKYTFKKEKQKVFMIKPLKQTFREEKEKSMHDKASQTNFQGRKRKKYA